MILLKKMIVVFLIFCFLYVFSFPALINAQPTASPKMDTLPEVTLPPLPDLPGMPSRKAKDGTMMIPRDSLHEPDINHPETLQSPLSSEDIDFTLENIKPPPVPKELLESRPLNSSPDIDINEPSGAIPLPSAQDKPWFLSWWFVLLVLFLISGLVLILFQKITPRPKTKEKESSFLSSKKEK